MAENSEIDQQFLKSQEKKAIAYRYKLGFPWDGTSRCPFVPGQKKLLSQCPFVPGQEQEQNSQGKLLCPGTKSISLKNQKTGKGHSKTEKEHSKTEEDVLEEEKDVLKQQKMF